MLVLLLFAFLSGLVTIAAPCIWPLLPIVLSSSATGGRRKPLGITIGIVCSFGFFTSAISYLIQAFGLDLNLLRLLAVIVIAFLRVTLLVPQISAILEGYVSRFAGSVGQSNTKQA